MCDPAFTRKSSSLKEMVNLRQSRIVPYFSDLWLSFYVCIDRRYTSQRDSWRFTRYTNLWFGSFIRNRGRAGWLRKPPSIARLLYQLPTSFRLHTLHTDLYSSESSGSLEPFDACIFRAAPCSIFPIILDF